jgi:Glutaredoxin-like domain (DUF836)
VGGGGVRVGLTRAPLPPKSGSKLPHSKGLMRLTLITRRDCHLCEEMAAVILEVAPAFAAAVDVRDVDSDPDLRARYTDEVPVLLIDGRKAFKYRTTARELERRLRAAQRRDLLHRWRRRLSGRRPT